MLSTSVQGSYLINKQLQANLSYVKSEIPFLGETATVENSEESNTMSEEILSKIVGNKVETNMKFFLGNSFYVEPGLFRETFSGENSEAYSMYDNEYKIESTTYGAQVHIGNQWMWDSGLFIDARWVGISTLLYKDTKLTPVAANLAEDEIKSAIDKFNSNDLEMLSSANVLLLSLGFAF